VPNMIASYQKAEHLSPNPELRAFLAALQAQPLVPPDSAAGADTARASPNRGTSKQ